MTAMGPIMLAMGAVMTGMRPVMLAMASIMTGTSPIMLAMNLLVKNHVNAFTLNIKHYDMLMHSQWRCISRWQSPALRLAARQIAGILYVLYFRVSFPTKKSITPLISPILY